MAAMASFIAFAVISFAVVAGLDETIEYALTVNAELREAERRAGYIASAIAGMIQRTALELDAVQRDREDHPVRNPVGLARLLDLAEHWARWSPELLRLTVSDTDGRVLAEVRIDEGGRPRAQSMTTAPAITAPSIEPAPPLGFRFALSHRPREPVRIAATAPLHRPGEPARYLTAVLAPERAAFAESLASEIAPILQTMRFAAPKRSTGPEAGDGNASGSTHRRLVTRYDGVEGVLQAVYHATVPPVDLHFKVEPSRRAWSAELRRAEFLFALFIGILVCVALTAYRFVVRPLRELHAGVLDISSGCLDRAIVPPHGPREIWEMARNIEAMRASLRTLTLDLERRVTERTAALARQNFQFDMVLKHMGHGLAMFDDHRRLVDCNDRFLAMFGLSRRNIRAMDLRELVTHCLKRIPSGRIRLDSVFRRLEHMCSERRGRTFIVRLTGGRVAEVIYHPMPDGGALFTTWDVTERRRVEARLRGALAEARQANRSKSVFLATMSHELRTPLNAVIGFSDMIASEVLGPIGNARYLEYVRDISESGHHLLRLIDDILDLSKAEAGTLGIRFAATNVREVVTSSILLVRDFAERGRVDLRLDGDAPELGVMTDGARLKQVLLNLLSNAIKFTPESGRVSLRVTPRESDGSIEFVVVDTGIGMAGADLSTAFQLFGQVESPLSRRFPGAGLGLPLTKRLVELLGGSLVVRSAPGKGTAVTVVVPQGGPMAKADGTLRLVDAVRRDMPNRSG